MRISRAFLAATLAGVLTLSAVSPAMAADPSDEGAVVMMTKIDGVLRPVDLELQESASLDLKATPAMDPDSMSASLIDFTQWVSCFTLNNADDEFQLYTWFWNGTPKDIRLKCGTDGWGYKHIRNGHESGWQATLNSARAAGWNTGSIATSGSWDDLMSAAVSNAIAWGDFVGGNALNNTTCANSAVLFVNSATGAVVYEFNVTAVWANDSDRLITAYKTSSSVC